MELVVWCSQAVLCFFAWNRLTEILLSKWKLNRSQFYLVSAVFLFLSTQIATAVFLLLAGTLLVLSAWLKDKVTKLPLIANTVSFMAVFVTGYEWLLRQTTMLTQMSDPPAWIFWLTENYLHGLLMGLLIGAVLAFVSRHAAHGWWVALNLLTASVISLSGAWGIVLGDFFITALLRPRSVGGLIVFAIAAVSTPLLQPLAEGWMNGELAIMVGSLVVLDFLAGYLITSFYGERSRSQQKDKGT